MFERIEENSELEIDNGVNFWWELAKAGLWAGGSMLLSLVVMIIVSACNVVVPVFPPFIMLWAFGVAFGLSAMHSGFSTLDENKIESGLLLGGGLATVGAIIGSILGAFVFPLLGSLLGAAIGALIGGALGFVAALITGLCYDHFNPSSPEEDSEFEDLSGEDFNNRMKGLGPELNSKLVEKPTESYRSLLVENEQTIKKDEVISNYTKTL